MTFSLISPLLIYLLTLTHIQAFRKNYKETQLWEEEVAKQEAEWKEYDTEYYKWLQEVTEVEKEYQNAIQAQELKKQALFEQQQALENTLTVNDEHILQTGNENKSQNLEKSDEMIAQPIGLFDKIKAFFGFSNQYVNIDYDEDKKILQNYETFDKNLELENMSPFTDETEQESREKEKQQEEEEEEEEVEEEDEEEEEKKKKEEKDTQNEKKQQKTRKQENLQSHNESNSPKPLLNGEKKHITQQNIHSNKNIDSIERQTSEIVENDDNDSKKDSIVYENIEGASQIVNDSENEYETDS